LADGLILVDPPVSHRRSTGQCEAPRSIGREIIRRIHPPVNAGEDMLLLMGDTGGG